jgi:hypothetical protein
MQVLCPTDKSIHIDVEQVQSSVRLLEARYVCSVTSGGGGGPNFQNKVRRGADHQSPLVFI